eukprot:CAMPEP_0201717148 /NCGR_PEP_ID=MMETSP0593-20130828/2943_1 /ASSEMBLY_ACC=CAM_ASM_000672 /TAXON_ID=267983 /ORGANISM="Skeletonema japonicum, Strain CCMP2506" /LENGTH=462 /DNA_ID=CAMNT_0048207117 /DNA_START=10 /DNA_END=1398 /DNA_ORIENTATION=-
MSMEAAQKQLDDSASEIAKKDKIIQDRTREIAALKSQLATAERSLTIATNAKKRIQEKNAEALKMVKSDSKLIFEKVARSLKLVEQSNGTLGRDSMDDMISLGNDTDIIKLAQDLTAARGQSVLGAISSIKTVWDKQKLLSPALTTSLTILVHRVFELILKDSFSSYSRLEIKSLPLLTSVVGLTTNPTQCYSELATVVNHVAVHLKEEKTTLLSWMDREKDYIIDLLVPVHDAIESEAGNSTKEGLMREIKSGLLDSVNQIVVVKNYSMPKEAAIARRSGYGDIHQFLLSPTETTLNLNLTKKGRMDVHRLIDNNFCAAVSHTSRGSGHQRILVLTKRNAESPSDLKAKKERKEKHMELLVKFNMYQKFTLTLPPTGTKLGLILRTNEAFGNMTEIKDVVADSPLENFIPKDVHIVSLRGDAIGFVQPRSMKDTIAAFTEVQAAASKQLEFIVVPTSATSV